MTRFYSIDEANTALPEVERILADLRDQRAGRSQLRDRVLEATPDGDETPSAGAAEQIRLLRLGMQGLIDQMQAGVARLIEMDITLRDISTGLIDFPALVAGRPIWLCWRLGEADVATWHPHDEGYDSRRPLSELPMGHGSSTPAA